MNIDYHFISNVLIKFSGILFILFNTPLSALEIKKTSVPKNLSTVEWHLIKFQSMDDTLGTISTDGRGAYTLQLHKDGTTSMSFKCQQAKGTWDPKPYENGVSGRFEIDSFSANEQNCTPSDMEKSMLNQTKFIHSYMLNDNRLYLILSADGGLYVWGQQQTSTPEKTIYLSAEDGGPRNWEVIIDSNLLNLREQPSTSSPIITGYPKGVILDNLGCKRYQHDLWCNVQELNGGVRGYVSAQYLKPAVSPDGSSPKGPDDSAFRAGLGKYDAKGTLSCTHDSYLLIGQCEYEVTRSGGGYATVVIKHPKKLTRTLFFRMGRAVGADTSGTVFHFHAEKEKDQNYIDVGNEHYIIPDSIIFGK